MTVDKSVTIPKISYMMVHELRKVLEDLPEGGIVTVSTHQGDYGQGDYHSMTIDWTEEL